MAKENLKSPPTCYTCGKDGSSPAEEGARRQDKVLHYLRHSHGGSEEFTENLHLPEATERRAAPVTNFRSIEKEKRNRCAAARAGERKALTPGAGNS